MCVALLALGAVADQYDALLPERARQWSRLFLGSQSRPDALAGGNVYIVTNDVVYFTDRTFELRPGETLLVYTDGVSESATADRAFYGTDRLTAFLNGHRELSLEQLVKGLRADVAAFAGGVPQSDDITVLAVTYNGNRQYIFCNLGAAQTYTGR